MSASAKRERVHGRLGDARDDAIRLAQESGQTAYVRCRVMTGYFASLERGSNPIAVFDPARLPALPICELAARGWATGRRPKTYTTCPACGRAIYVKADGTTAPHQPKQRKVS